MPFDFKKEYKEFYMPKDKPEIITYGIAFTIKMSNKGDHQIDGYFDYVVPSLEGFWWMEGKGSIFFMGKLDF